MVCGTSKRFVVLSRNWQLAVYVCLFVRIRLNLGSLKQLPFGILSFCCCCCSGAVEMSNFCNAAFDMSPPEQSTTISPPPKFKFKHIFQAVPQTNTTNAQHLSGSRQYNNCSMHTSRKRQQMLTIFQAAFNTTTAQCTQVVKYNKCGCPL